MRYEWFIAFRYLKSRRKQTFISIISVISVGGVTLGVAAVIIVVSALDGFSHGLKEKFLANDAHVSVHSVQGYFLNYREKIDQIEAIEGVVAASPVIISQLAIQPQNSEAIEGMIYVKGIDLQQENRVTGFSDFVADFSKFNQSPYIDEARMRLAGTETIAGGIVSRASCRKSTASYSRRRSSPYPEDGAKSRQPFFVYSKNAKFCCSWVLPVGVLHS